MRVLLVILLLFAFVASAQSWEALTHYQLGIESSIDPNGSFQNLPDSWPSHRDIWKWFEITEWFAWSHGVQRTGRTTTIPNVPAYPTDMRNPGEDLYRIYKNNPAAPATLYNTAWFHGSRGPRPTGAL
jgi:hypothetical protein